MYSVHVTIAKTYPAMNTLKLLLALCFCLFVCLFVSVFVLFFFFSQLMRIQSRVDYRCMSTEIYFHTSFCHGSSTKVFRVVYQENLGIFLTTMSQTTFTFLHFLCSHPYRTERQGYRSKTSTQLSLLLSSYLMENRHD